MNIQSSRSHLIFTMLMERKNIITGVKTSSKISFVDLAGSERVARSGAVDDKNRLNGDPNFVLQEYSFFPIVLKLSTNISLPPGLHKCCMNYFC